MYSIPFVLAGLLALVVVTSSAPSKMPDGFLKCKRDDPKVDECLKNAIQNVVPHFVKGVPSFGIYTIDPLRITELDIGQGKGPVAVDLRFKNLAIKGFRSARILSVKTDFRNQKMVIKLKLEKPLILDGDYEIKGKVLILPVTGKGKSLLKLDNLEAVLTLSGKEVKRDNDMYFDIRKFDVKFETTRLHMKFDRLFNNEKALGDNMNRFLNDNWREILQEVKPGFEEALGATFKEIASRFYSKVPTKNIYL